VSSISLFLNNRTKEDKLNEYHSVYQVNYRIKLEVTSNHQTFSPGSVFDKKPVKEIGWIFLKF
jgi:hypothetical protein